MSLVLIAAVAKNRVIGYKGKLLWNLPEDLIRFRNLTISHPLIVGRITLESILKKLGKPFPNRVNIVVTRRPDYRYRGLYVCHSIEDACSLAESFDTTAYVIGGQQVYEQTINLPQTKRLELTEVDGEYEGDAFFPEFDSDEWEEASRIDKQHYSFVTYYRR